MKESETLPNTLALGALCAALVTVLTMVSVPVPGYRLYFNLGEGGVYLSALLFGPRTGFLAGALGASAGDLILGYPMWAPLSFVIKGLEGFVTGYLARRTKPIWAMGAGALVMITGYTAGAYVMYGAAAAPVETMTDLVQTSVGMVAALAVLRPLKNLLKERFKKSAPRE
ncbi:putative membrane protein [Thermanaerovibrio velox DSM 12556]|uniref:Putative membrane protein n=1 Tax=Thermanaerovibrio velox DSM 12556 TaxID=926567 RepID=H0UQ41_9BACT|nr:ECF transporter S component [Thermanaerovibrio velox]EHM09670.1 putative membrane protein [Thermanaerovibrio velox DSM 12556]